MNRLNVVIQLTWCDDMDICQKTNIHKLDYFFYYPHLKNRLNWDCDIGVLVKSYFVTVQNAWSSVLRRDEI